MYSGTCVPVTARIKKCPHPGWAHAQRQCRLKEGCSISFIDYTQMWGSEPPSPGETLSQQGRNPDPDQGVPGSQEDHWEEHQVFPAHKTQQNTHLPHTLWENLSPKGRLWIGGFLKPCNSAHQSLSIPAAQPGGRLFWAYLVSIHLTCCESASPAEETAAGLQDCLLVSLLRGPSGGSHGQRGHWHIAAKPRQSSGKRETRFM